MKNRFDPDEVQQIQKVKQLFSNNGLAITRAFYNGEHIIIETMMVGTGNYNPGILIPIKPFIEWSSLLVPNGYSFDKSEQKEWLVNYINEGGKFNIENRKPDSILQTLFESFNPFACRK